MQSTIVAKNIYSTQTTIPRALEEVGALYERTLTGGSLKGWRVSSDVDALIKFTLHYQARLTANFTTHQETDLRVALIGDLKVWLHTLLAISDYVQSRGLESIETSQISEATERYNMRAHALALFLGELSAAPVSADTKKIINDLEPKLVAQLKGKSEREIFQVVSRVVPVDTPLEEELTSLFMNLIKSTHTEPAVQTLVTQDNFLLTHDALCRTFASSQELHDYVAPYLSALLKKALSKEGVEAFDDCFRNTYFAVVNRVINYYQTYRPEAGADTGKGLGVKGEEPAGASETVGGDNASRFTPHASPKTQSDTPSPQSTSVQDQLDTSDSATPLPPLEGPESRTTPLITQAEANSAEKLADGKSVRIQGTGLD